MRKRFDDVPEFSWIQLMRAIWFFLEGMRGKFLFWTGALIAVSFYQLVPSLIISRIIDFFTAYRAGDSLMPFYGYVLFLGIGHGATSALRLTAKNKTGQLSTDLSYRVRVRGFERLVDFSLAWHDRENTGNKVQRIQAGATALVDLRRLMSHSGFQTITAIVGIVFVFLFLNIQFLLFLIVYLAVFFYINGSYYRRMLTLQNEYNKSREAAGGSYFEGLSNVLTIKTLGAKSEFSKNIHAAEQTARNHSYEMINLGTGKWKVFQYFTAVSMMVYLLMVGNNLINGAITVGSIFIFYNYFWKLIDAAGTSTELFENMTEIKAAVARMMPMYWENETLLKGAKPFPKEWNTIAINEGNFSYRGQSKQADEDVFEIKGLNLRINKYERIGIAGRSGSGKSTFAKLLLGLYQLEGGAFTVDATGFYDILHKDVTSRISIVLQETEMFNLTLRENITLLKETDVKLLEKAIRIAQLEELIARLPGGLGTEIGEKGYRLSGGERQRIGIARAIYKNPEIFVFDEATSALDTKTEAKIQEALEAELTGKTIITIAHRVTTLKNATRIWVFEKGKIAEEGKYDILNEDKASRFYQISHAKNTT